MNQQKDASVVLSEELKGWARWPPSKETIYFVVKLLIGVIIAITAIRVLGLFTSYLYFLDQVVTTLGIGDSAARPIAVVLTGASFAIFPWIVSFVVFGARKVELFIALLAGSMIVFLGSLASEDVYFNRRTGESTKCYAKTLDGFKFSGSCDFDPHLGVRFQKITPVIAREIYFWKKNGTMERPSQVVEGKYFDPLTGEPIVWYALREDGVIALFPLPGFDPLTSVQLAPVTKEIIRQYDLDAGIGTNPSSPVSSRTIRREIGRLMLAKQEYNSFMMTYVKPGFFSNVDKVQERRHNQLNGEYFYQCKVVRDLVWRFESREYVSSEAYVGGLGYEVKVERVISVSPYTIFVLEVNNMSDYIQNDLRFSYRIYDNMMRPARVLVGIPDEYSSKRFINNDFFQVTLDGKESGRFLVVVKDNGLSLQTGYVRINVTALKFQLRD